MHVAPEDIIHAMEMEERRSKAGTGGQRGQRAVSFNMSHVISSTSMNAIIVFSDLLEKHMDERAAGGRVHWKPVHSVRCAVVPDQ